MYKKSANAKDVKKPLLVFMILLMAPLAGIGIDLYTPSLPAITSYFQTETSLVKLTLAVYLIGYAIGQPVMGTFSDCFGRKYPLFIGVLLYFLASLCAAFSPNIYILLIMRLIQGLGMSAPGTIGKAIITDTFPDHQLPKYALYIATAWSIGPVIAPALGGYLQYYFGWQSAFYFLAGYGFIILMLIALTFNESNKKLHPLKIKAILRNYTTILADKRFIGYVLCMAILYSLLLVFNTLAPFLVQVDMQYSPIAYGHIALLLGLIYFFGNLVNRFLLHYLSAKKIFTISLYTSFVLSIVMVVISILFPLNIYAIVIPNAALFFISCMIFASSMGLAMGLFREMAGTASAIMGFMFVLGTGLTSATVSLFHVKTQLPIALSYLVLLSLGIIIKLTVLRSPQ